MRWGLSYDSKQGFQTLDSSDVGLAEGLWKHIPGPYLDILVQEIWDGALGFVFSWWFSDDLDAARFGKLEGSDTSLGLKISCFQ